MGFSIIDGCVVLTLLGVLVYKDMSKSSQSVIAGNKYPFSIGLIHLISGYLMPLSLARVWLISLGFIVWKLLLPGILIDITLIIGSRLIWLCHAVELSMEEE